MVIARSASDEAISWLLGDCFADTLTSFSAWFTLSTFVTLSVNSANVLATTKALPALARQSS